MKMTNMDQIYEMLVKCFLFEKHVLKTCMGGAINEGNP
jgi:hypothetical protein